MKLIVNEEQAKKLIRLIKEDCVNCQQYTYSPDNVLIVKKYLDDNFKKGNFAGVGEDGRPSNTPIVAMINVQTGQPTQNMFDHQLLDLLIDEFQGMFVDKNERSRFLSQVMRDWYEDKIGLYGNLSVNHV